MGTVRTYYQTTQGVDLAAVVQGAEAYDAPEYLDRLAADLGLPAGSVVAIVRSDAAPDPRTTPRALWLGNVPDPPARATVRDVLTALANGNNAQARDALSRLG